MTCIPTVSICLSRIKVIVWTACPLFINTHTAGRIMEVGSTTRSQAFEWGDLLGRMHFALDPMEFPTISERTFIWAWEGVPKVGEALADIRLIQSEKRPSDPRKLLNYLPKLVVLQS